MLDDRFKKRYREIPLAIHEIQPAKGFAQKTILTLLHIHEEVEILHITDGEAMVYLDGVEYHAEKGDTLFVSPWCAHRIDVLPGKFGYICVCFNSILLGSREQAKAVASRKKLMPSLVNSKKIACSVKNIASDYKKDDKGWTYRAQGELLKIFGEIISLLEEEYHASDSEFCLKIYRYIKDNFAEQITSRDCADSLHIDQSSFCRKFKSYFGNTFSNYLCAFRLERAKQLLEEGNLSVTEIGNRTGFTGTSYFIMKYKQIYGVTPKQSTKKEKII